MTKVRYEVDFAKYQSEVELINARNSVEVGLYFIVELLIRGTLSEEYNVINVSSRRKWSGDDYPRYISGAGFPDLLILHKDKPDPCATVEVKYLPFKNGLGETIDEQEQLKEHIKKFNTVVYTNCLEWRIYHKEISNPITVKLGRYHTEEIEWFDASNWERLITQLEGLF
ncbi:hypothetical protein [Virgibacillus dokdonensis]|uniref:hypothetical protein n=1 Tax=Virgibacillus dokdonensis TaxID=302167 RepID=UPI00098B6405|nr:hypothetical protein [Virgibacillus dokdonensis]